MNWFPKQKVFIIAGFIFLMLLRGDFSIEGVSRILGINEPIEEKCVSIKTGITPEQVSDLLGKPNMTTRSGGQNNMPEIMMWTYNESFFTKTCSIMFQADKVFSSNWLGI